MPDEKIEVEWIATATKMNQVLDRLEGKLDKQEKALKKIGDASKKSTAEAVTGFNKLEKEFRDAEKSLKKMTAGTAEFARQKKKVDELRAAFNKANKELKDTPKSPWKKIGGGMVVATGAAVALAAALVKVADAQRQIVSGGADVAVKMDTLTRRLQVQQGLTDPESKERTEEIVKLSSRMGLTGEEGMQAAVQLASSGFQDPLKSGALETVLAAKQASNFDGDIRELIKGLAQAITAEGKVKNNQNLQATAVAAQGLFKTTDFQLSELGDFAKQASVFEGANLTQNQSLAGFTALRETLPAAESARGLRNFVLKLQKGDQTKESSEALQQLGVKPDQVDFVGENLVDVIKTIKSSTDKLPEQDRNKALIKAFGLENIASAKLLLNAGQRIPELEKQQTDVAQFRKDAAINAGGMQGDINRRGNAEMLDVMPIAGQLHKMNERALNNEREDKAAERRLVVNQPFPGAAVGLNVLNRAKRGVEEVFGGDIGRTSPDEVKNLLRGILDKQGEANDIMKQQMQNGQRQPAQPAARPRQAPLPAVNVP